MAISRRSMMLGTAAGGAAALTLAACGSDDSGSGGAGSGGGSGEVIYANTTEPENPLLPANTGEAGGGRIVALIYAGLVYYKADGAIENAIAASIHSEDNHNGTTKFR